MGPNIEVINFFFLQKKEEELLEAGGSLGKLTEGATPPEEQRIVEGQRDDSANTEGEYQ